MNKITKLVQGVLNRYVGEPFPVTKYEIIQIGYQYWRDVPPTSVEQWIYDEIAKNGSLGRVNIRITTDAKTVDADFHINEFLPSFTSTRVSEVQKKFGHLTEGGVECI